MIKLKKLIKESPDYIKSQSLTYHDTDAYPFEYIGNQLYVGESGEIHGTLSRKVAKKSKKFNLKIKYEGRFWEKSKIITFWEYPPKTKLKKVIQDIEKVAKIKIWNDPKWRIEVKVKGNYQEKLISLQDYVESSKPKRTQHVKSPVAKFEKVPKGVGSLKKPKDLKKGETMAQYHNRKQQENKMSKLKNLIPEEILKEDKTSPWSQQNIKDMNTVTRLGESLTKHITEINKDLDKLENLWQARRKSTWPSPLETLMLKGQKIGADYVSLETARFNLKQISKWLSEIEKNAGDLLKGISTGKYE